MRRAWCTAVLVLGLGCSDIFDAPDDGGDPERYSHPTPDSPTITGVEAGDGRITVSFTPGAYAGSGPNVEYRVVCRSPSDNGITASGPKSPLSVTGLVNGTTYSCVAVAIRSNPYSYTTLSAPSNAMTATPVAPSG
jgi:titin